MRMKLGIFVVIAAAAMTASYATVRAAQESGKSTWDGVYSDAQANKGEAIYNDKCAKCHGVDGSGGDAPELQGGGFAADWDGLSVAQLFASSFLMEPTASGIFFRREGRILLQMSIHLSTGSDRGAQIWVRAAREAGRGGENWGYVEGQVAER